MRVSTARVAAIVGAVVVLVLAGVVLTLSLPGRQPAPGQAAATAMPTAQTTDGAAAVTAMPTAQTTDRASSTSPEDQLSQSDAFWAQWTEPILGHLPFNAKSLAEATEQADLIVRGRISDLYVGEHWFVADTSYPLDYVRVEISAVLKGEPRSRTAGFVEVQMGHVEQDDLDELRAKMPTHDHLWFLMYDANWGSRGDSPMASAEIAPYAYFISNEYQGVFRDIGGTVRLVQPEELARVLDPEHFPLMHEGASFDQIVDDVRQFAEELP